MEQSNTAEPNTSTSTVETPCFYVTRIFITAYSRAHSWSLS